MPCSCVWYACGSCYLHGLPTSVFAEYSTWISCATIGNGCYRKRVENAGSGSGLDGGPFASS